MMMMMMVSYYAVGLGLHYAINATAEFAKVITKRRV